MNNMRELTDSSPKSGRLSDFNDKVVVVTGADLELAKKPPEASQGEVRLFIAWTSMSAAFSRRKVLLKQQVARRKWRLWTFQMKTP